MSRTLRERLFSLGTIFVIGGAAGVALLLLFEGAETDRLWLGISSAYCLAAGLVMLVWPRSERWGLVGMGLLMIASAGVRMWDEGFSALRLGLLLVGVWLLLPITTSAGANEPDADHPDAGGADSAAARNQPIAALVQGRDPAKVFAAVHERVVRHYGEGYDLADLREPERVFLLAYHGVGLVGNGGFGYLFEGNIPGDPHYQKTARAYEVIGCRPAADAFHKALALFPGARPPEDPDERLRVYRRASGPTRGAIDQEFWDAQEAVDRRLIAYLRKHADELAHLDGAPAAARKGGSPRPPQKRRGPAPD